MKKIISTLLLVLVLFNFIFCNKSYAVENNDKKIIDSMEDITAEDITAKSEENILNDGTTDGEYTGKMPTSFDSFDGNSGSIAAIVAVAFNTIPLMALAVMTVVSGVDTSDSDSIKILTIKRILKGEVPMFKPNLFDENNGPQQCSTGKAIMDNVQKWFYILRLIVACLSVITLIYIGIRMLIASTADGKSRYKKMLVGWFESIILLFTLQYILSFMFIVTQSLIDVFANFVTGDDFEDILFSRIINSLFSLSGWSFLLYTVMFWYIVFIQVRFCIMYIRRFIVMCFLIIIAPLICLLYPLDKAGDNKSQTFAAWMSEMIFSLIMQPIHLVIYLFFTGTAGEILVGYPITAMIFLFAFTKMDKYIFRMLNIKNAVGIKTFNETMKEKGI